jgi:putative ABC transport system permease protein
MIWMNILKAALKSILRSRMRGLLTTLGIIIGVCSVIMITVYPGSFMVGGINRGAGSINKFTITDVDNIKKEAVFVKGVQAVVNTSAQIIGPAGNWNTSIEGVSPEFQDIRSWKIASGEFFTERDIISRAKVCVVGTEIVKNLFSEGDPIGVNIRIKNVPFRIIGVLESKGQNAMGRNMDDVILAPCTTVLDRLVGSRNISYIQANALTVESIDSAQAEIKEIMRTSHKLDISEEDDFTIRNQTQIAEAFSSTAQILTLLLGSVAGVSLLVGGIGIMNIMLVSVTERTREIGIRLSIGARAADIMIQFLAESILLSLFGGVIGILISFGISFLFNTYDIMNMIISPGIVMLAFSFSAAVGIFFGFYPARKASNLNPIDALRYE